MDVFVFFFSSYFFPSIAALQSPPHTFPLGSTDQNELKCLRACYYSGTGSLFIRYDIYIESIVAAIAVLSYFSVAFMQFFSSQQFCNATDHTEFFAYVS